MGEMGEYMNKNPCKICVVKSMCGIPCDEFVIYLETNIDTNIPRRTYSMDILAKAIREGTHELCANDTRWRFKDD